MGLMHRDPDTGVPLHPAAETSMPRMGVSAWGNARVTLRGCTIMNMTYNGVCCMGESTVLIEDSVIKGCSMAGLYMEGEGNATVRGCSFHGNFICISVWGGFGEERLLKTGLEWDESDDNALVTPNCSMLLENNKFAGRTWAGEIRPADLVQQGNTYEDLDKMEDEEKDQDSEDDWQDMIERKPGDPKLKLWGLDEPITIPSWAPQNETGGDGVSFWFPRDMCINDT